MIKKERKGRGNIQQYYKGTPLKCFLVGELIKLVKQILLGMP
jgi:hypothetical protein